MEFRELTGIEKVERYRQGRAINGKLWACGESAATTEEMDMVHGLHVDEAFQRIRQSRIRASHLEEGHNL